MTIKINTLELAKLYENQGYLKDAFDTYEFLDKNTSSIEVRAGLKRMEKKMADSLPIKSSGDKVAQLFEKWLMLIILKHRLENFKKIKDRLF